MKKKNIIALIVTFVVGLVHFYINLPAINLHNTAFYTFFFTLSAIYCVLSLLFSGKIISNLQNPREIWSEVKTTCKIPVIICVVLLLINILGSLFSSVIFRANAYKDLLTVKEADFATEVVEISYDKIPLLDRASAERLGDRKLGELSDMVSQFEVMDDYVQINYKGTPVRVATLSYGDVFKWWNNKNNGLPAYIVIDMISQNVDVVRLPEGIRYSNADHFGRNIDRHLRFSYPTFMFGTPHFEIDDSGNPYWITPKVEMTIGLFGGRDIDGVVLTNALTGENKYYHANEVPTWVDQVYIAELIIEQYDYHGRYQNGFINSLFGQKGCTVTTDGYNYIAMNDDVYLYTGITSVGGDESNIGFILSNQRTKETHYYSCAGAEEYSAMSSAQGVVQHLGYKSTFPLLLNLSNEPTYFMALKDNAGLVKMYAMVNVRQYNIVATGSTVSECERNYYALLNQNNIKVETNKTLENVFGTVFDIRSSVINGNTIYYFNLTDDKTFYSVPASTCPEAVTINIGDFVTLQLEGEKGTAIVSCSKIERG